MKMEHEASPADEIHAELKGAHEGFQVVGTDILMAIYRRPEKTKGGIILTDNVQGEDLYQGKIGLVLKVGPLVADPSDPKSLREWFGSKIPKPGDWIVIRVGDTFAFNLSNVPCRVVEAKQLRGIVVEPDCVW